MADTASNGNGAFLDVRDLRKHFAIRRGFFSRVAGQVRAVDGVSFQLRQGEVLGLVGESGCGKTTLARAILRLIEPTSGDVFFDGIPVLALKGQELRRLRKRMQIIFQDPYGSLNPRLTVGSMVAEAIRIHKIARGQAVKRRVAELLERVGIPSEHMNRYPHEFSGGQRQRIGIARSLAVGPELIIADEPVSALDVSIQAQILNLLDDLRKDLGLTFLFIAHDLSVVEHISDRVAVMYLGRIVELADAVDLYKNAKHPYTKALMSAIPSMDPMRKSRRIVLEGDVPSPANVPAGCPFHTRCPEAMPRCRTQKPKPAEVGAGHTVSCWLHEGETHDLSD
ncbi:MAG: ABC transporter ATP-binding protein [Candidatus Latescibacterota bacterium]|nr:MAG: ABC transporter ATP-binding protein [Candidatus Latescibacterota bacterium]